jgi:NAD(P)H-nitrite reductase large subunit
MGDARGKDDRNHTTNGVSISPNKFISMPETASYPTGSLDFLAKLKQGESKEAHHDLDNPSRERQSKIRLNIIIVGAGLGGLSAGIALARRGHKVRVIEQAPVLGEVCVAS